MLKEEKIKESSHERVCYVLFPIRYGHWACRINGDMPWSPDHFIYSYDFDTWAEFNEVVEESVALLEEE